MKDERNRMEECVIPARNGSDSIKAACECLYTSLITFTKCFVAAEKYLHTHTRSLLLSPWKRRTFNESSRSEKLFQQKKIVSIATLGNSSNSLINFSSIFHSFSLSLSLFLFSSSFGSNLALVLHAIDITTYHSQGKRKREGGMGKRGI
jgi:hypothetical protein